MRRRSSEVLTNNCKLSECSSCSEQPGKGLRSHIFQQLNSKTQYDRAHESDFIRSGKNSSHTYPAHDLAQEAVLYYIKVVFGKAAFSVTRLRAFKSTMVRTP